MKRPSRLARGPATRAARDHLTSLHIEVYGYVTADTAAEISAMSWLRCAQDTANLTRAKADKDSLMRSREELKRLHRDLFGVNAQRDREKLEDIAGYDARRVQSELVILRRMQAAKDAARAERVLMLQRARNRAQVPAGRPDGDGAA